METRIFNGVALPEGGEVITFANGQPVVPAKPIVAYINGDGIGPEISAPTRTVVDAVVKHVYGGKRQVMWYEIFASEAASAKFGNPLPDDTLAAIKHLGVAMKGPLSTPTGEGHESFNVQMRQKLGLWRCVRPFSHIPGVPVAVLRPENVKGVIFRENIEDIYAGLEYQLGAEKATKLREFLRSLGETVRDDTGFGIKTMSKFGSERIVRAAIQYAIEKGLKTVTIVHKGNIQKFTEGAFVKWGYAMAAAEFGDRIVTEKDLWAKYDGKLPEGKILLNDRIADATFTEMLIRPERYSVLVTMNLNGDYLSDFVAGQLGGLGFAPGANIGDSCAIFEATHGTAADIAGKNLANPCSLILSAKMMLEYFGWNEAAEALQKTMETTIAKGQVTGDVKIAGAAKLSTTAFADALIANVGA